MNELPASGPALAGIVAALMADIESTVGPGHDALVAGHAQHQAQFTRELESYRQRVVEEVQQEIHDCFIDTAWPACPRHPNHPLWLHGEYWCCEQDGAIVCKLGELSSLPGNGAR